MGDLNHENWAGVTYGNSQMHRWLVKLLRVADVRLIYAFASLFVVPLAMVVNRKAFKAVYSFYRERIVCSPLMSLWMVYRNHCAFSQVVIDRFAMYAGKRFEIEVDGQDLFDRLSSAEKGFVQLSSHIGNYEIAGYSLVAKEKRFNALVFGGEKESVMRNRSRLFEGNNIRMIPVQADMSHVFLIDAALSAGEILSMPADRIFGSQKSFSMPFFGKSAKFPQGPFVMAAARDVPVLFVAVMKTGSRVYHITVRELSASSGGRMMSRAGELAEEYARLLEAAVREHPEQWYNYFDFWRQ